jgi:hypothetical protein
MDYDGKKPSKGAKARAILRGIGRRWSQNVPKIAFGNKLSALEVPFLSTMTTEMRPKSTSMLKLRLFVVFSS